VRTTYHCFRWVKEEASSQHTGDVDSSECDTDLNVLPKQLMQDLCSLNGDCDICGRTGVDKYKMCHLNGDERTDGEDSDDEREDDDDDEGAVGGVEELLMEVRYYFIFVVHLNYQLHPEYF
jgi:hypothetical protein